MKFNPDKIVKLSSEKERAEAKIKAIILTTLCRELKELDEKPSRELDEELSRKLDEESSRELDEEPNSTAVMNGGQTYGLPATRTSLPTVDKIKETYL